MITSDEAFGIILQHTIELGSETVPLDQCLGRTLAEDILPDRPFPPFDRVCMDGIAIDYAAYQKGNRKFKTEAVQAAGQPPHVLLDPLHAVEIMTGAVLPEGTTTVIRYEDLKPVEGGFEVIDGLKDNANIHYQGSDLDGSGVLIPKGSHIRSAEVGILATVGHSMVRVYRLPKVAIVSTGDELVSVEETPKPHQIRRSNVHMLAAAAKALGIEADLRHVADDKASIEQLFDEVFSRYDAVLMSGGVSKGKYDHIPDVLQEKGVEIIFHRVKQRPGKPFLFGSRGDVKIFAFPGNPVSTIVGFNKYFEPWLLACMGSETARPLVELAQDVFFKPDLTYFAQASLKVIEGKLLVDVAHGNGSGDMVNMASVDGFVELPRGKETFKKGERYPFLKL